MTIDSRAYVQGTSLGRAPSPVSSQTSGSRRAVSKLFFFLGILCYVDPLWIKGQNQKGFWLPSFLSLSPSPDSITHFWQVAGKQLRRTVLLWSTGSHLLTRLLLFVSRNVTKEQM